MKKYILSLFLLTSLISCSKKSAPIQENPKITTTVTTVASTTRFSLDGKLFNKITGEPIPMEDFAKMIKENPSIPLEKVYNKYGVPEKVFYHPNPPANFGKRDPELKPKVGEPFPEFVFQTVEGDEIESKKLNGQWILVRFDFFTNMMNKEDYAMLVDAIDQIPKSSKITTILCSLDTKENVIKELGKSSKKIELVSDGQGFSAKYQIGKFPTTMLIAPDQTLYKFLEKSEYQEIGSIIE